MDDSMDSDSAESGMSETNDKSFESVAKSESLETLKTKLVDCLESLQSAGTFAFFEHLPNPVNPGLCVKGVGPIGLPLSDRDAKAIKEAFGKQSEDQPFELHSRYFETKNPAWQTFINSMLSKIMLGLGIEHEGGTIGFELRAMRLYDKNSKVNLIQHDSKKSPDTFGDLAICLPSKHEGGEINITHIGKSMIHETALYSEFDSSLMAWYSDVDLSKMYIKSGQQLVLFYTVHFTGSAAGSASKAIEGSARLLTNIASWKADYKQNGTPEVLAYILDHKVSAAICSNALEGHDRQVVKYLQEACSQTGYHLYLARLERKVYGATEMYDDYDDWRCSDEEHREILEEKSVVVKLTKVASLDGIVIGQNVRITDDEIIQDDLFVREPDEEHHEFGCGTSTHYYRETAAIIMPGETRVEFFLGPERDLAFSQEERTESMKTWLMDLSNDLDRNRSNTKIAEDLVHACRIVTHAMNKFFAKPQSLYSCDMPYSAEIVELLCKIAIKLAEIQFLELGQDVFLEISRLNFWRMLESFGSSSSIFQSIGRGIAVFGLQLSASIISDGVSRVTSLHRRCSILEAFAAGYTFANWGLLLSEKPDLSTSEDGIANSLGVVHPDFSAWINGAYKQALIQCDISHTEDVTCLTKIAAAFGTEFLLHSITTALKKNMRASGDVVMTFMIELVKTNDKSGLPPPAAVEAFRDVLPEMVQNFSLQYVGPSGCKRRKWGSGVHHGTNYNRNLDLVERPTNTSENIAEILCQCVALGLTSEADQIISKVLAQFHSMPAEHIGEVTQVFLKRVLMHISKQEANLTHPRLQLLFQHSLAIYIDRFVKPEPTKPTNWTRPTRGCGCIHCEGLDAFLRSPVKQEFRCNSGAKPRGHLEAMLQQDYGDYKLVTDKHRSPHTLIITKTVFNGHYTREHDAWDRRAKTAVARMTELGVEPLKKLLGDQYDATMGLRWVRIATRYLGARPLNNMAQGADEIEVITID